MTFFESLLLLLAIAIGLLQISRRLAIPYPTMLAAAGVLLALVPGAPTITLDPATALALLIAPALCDAAYEFPARAVWRLWRPLLAFAVFAVVLSAAAVAFVGVQVVGLPLFAAIALGAIVAPPDAAAATAILGSVRMPRRSVAILKGESLLNDATALLLFTAAVSFHGRGNMDAGLAIQLGLAAPGGVLLGIALAWLLRFLLPFFNRTLSAYLLEYLFSFGAWIVAEHLHLSAVLCVVAFAMTFARLESQVTPPLMRLHNVAISHTTVFLFNVLAFLLMGFQARSIVEAMAPDRLREAAWFATLVIVVLIVVRMAWVVTFNRLAHRFKFVRGDFTPSSLRHAVLVGWCGMRGLVTLATAIALPADFPQRDLIVLTAFAVVLATLVVQGLTLAPLVRWLGLDAEDGLAAELAETRADLVATALASLENDKGPVADHWRFAFNTVRLSVVPGGDPSRLQDRRRLGQKAMHRQRERLEHLHHEQRIGPDAFAILQEELDIAEVALTTECERQIAES